MTYKLSICIPTFNRANYLPSTLDSIITQMVEGVEIIVCDNNSDDNTDEIIKVYANKYPYIKYYKNPQNIGADLNYLEVVRHATGTYCIIFGSDDILLDGALEKMINYLESDCDYYFFNRIYGATIYNAITQKPFSCEKDKKYILDEDSKIIKLMNACNSTLGLFAYISNVIFKKKLWDNVELNYEYVGTAYLHVYFHFKVILARAAIIYYINDAYVFALAGNDSFYQNAAQRLLLDLSGYYKLSLLFPNKTVRLALYPVVTRLVPLNSPLFLLLAINTNPEYRQEILSYTKFYPYDYTWLIRLLTTKAGLKLINFLKVLKKMIEALNKRFNSRSRR